MVPVHCVWNAWEKYQIHILNTHNIRSVCPPDVCLHQKIQVTNYLLSPTVQSLTSYCILIDSILSSLLDICLASSCFFSNSRLSSCNSLPSMAWRKAYWVLIALDWGVLGTSPLSGVSASWSTQYIPHMNRQNPDFFTVYQFATLLFPAVIEWAFHQWRLASDRNFGPSNHI